MSIGFRLNGDFSRIDMRDGIFRHHLQPEAMPGRIMRPCDDTVRQDHFPTITRIAFGSTLYPPETVR